MNATIGVATLAMAAASPAGLVQATTTAQAVVTVPMMGSARKQDSALATRNAPQDLSAMTAQAVFLKAATTFVSPMHNAQAVASATSKAVLA